MSPHKVLLDSADLVIKTWVIGQKQHTGRSGREKDYR